MRGLRFALAVSATVGLASAAHAASLRVTAIDQTWRVPAGDPAYDPSQWVALEFELDASGAPYTLTSANLEWMLAQGEFFHLPSAGLLRPTPEQIAATPALRYSTFVDLSPVPASALLGFGFIQAAQISAGVVVTPFGQAITLQPGQRIRVARVTVRPGAAPINPTLMVGRPGGVIDNLPYSFPLTPFGSIRISETGDQYDNDMTLRVTLAGNNEFVQTGAFLPASRVTAVPGEYPGWTVRKDYVSGVHGVSITPLHTLAPTETLDIRFLTATSGRDLRYAHQPFRWDFGWWAPLAGPSIPGDADDDGRVGFSDLNLVLAHFGELQQTPYRLQADLSGNGIVDFLDLNIVLGAYGAVEPR